MGEVKECPEPCTTEAAHYLRYPCAREESPRPVKMPDSRSAKPFGNESKGKHGEIETLQWRRPTENCAAHLDSSESRVEWGLVRARIKWIVKDGRRCRDERREQLGEHTRPLNKVVHDNRPWRRISAVAQERNHEECRVGE
jgi:hypothetical protein